MKPLPWSFSALESFISCPRSYHAQRVAKTVPYEQSPEAAWGVKVHKAFEDRQKFGRKLPTHLEEHEFFMEWLEKLPGNFEAERKVALNRKREICGYRDKDVWYRGVLDYTKVHEEKAIVIDYKTGKPSKKDRQTKMFALTIFIEFPHVEKVRAIYYWTKDQSSTKYDYHRSDVDDLWGEFIPDLQQYAQAFREDIWQPRQSGLCNGWCPVQDCEFWKPKREWKK